MTEDFTVLVGILASGSIAINLYLIKSIANLCERLARVEGSLNHKQEIESLSLMELDPNLALALVAIAMPASIIGVLKSFASGR